MAKSWKPEKKWYYGRAKMPLYDMGIQTISKLSYSFITKLIFYTNNTSNVYEKWFRLDKINKQKTKGEFILLGN